MISYSLLSLFDNNYVVCELKLLLHNSLQMCKAVQDLLRIKLGCMGSGGEH